MVDSGALGGLKEQGKAILLFLGVAILAVLGIVVLVEFNTSIPNATADVNTTINAFIAAMVIFGTFASVVALIIVVKAVISVVRGLQ